MKQTNLLDIATQSSGDKSNAIFRPLVAVLLCIAIWVTAPNADATQWMLGGFITLCLSDLVRGLTLPTSKVAFAFDLVGIAAISGAYWSQLDSEIIWWLPAFLFASGVIVFLLMLPQLDTLLAPVTLMGMVLVQLLWASGEVWLAQMSLFSLIGFIGSLVLLASQMLFVLHHYRKPVQNGEAWGSVSYFVALFFIALSIIFALHQTA
ncbi:membrane protein [Vibrio nigripulchritudo]|uniref:lysoplasmalogenase n=1 Tax=Vibrio nigripulchritudo TaxID=28173 RepID=UPI00190A0D28|nr:lysoplasmalogenase [Vibrio nigripulchritudo]BCL71547.1 membrane protein [Vibrio nigripulchritudo]BDU32904.1 membrane protein [Vibrio nigripulchritudo]